MQVSVVLAVAAAGAAGAALRYAATVLLRQWFEIGPLPIAVVNVLGCLGFGVCLAWAQGRWSPLVQAAVLAGFFGAFTTFSAFAYDCVDLLEERRYGLVALNVLLQNALGVAGLWLGMTLASARQ